MLNLARIAALGALLSAALAHPAAAAPFIDSATIDFGTPLGSATCKAVDGTAADPGDGSRVVITKDNSSDPGAPSSGFVKLFSKAGGFYMRSNTSGVRALLRDGTTVTAAQGGTGIASYTQGDIVYASGSTTLAKLAKGTQAQVVGYNATVPTPVSPAVASTDTTCDATGTFSDNATVITLADYDNTNRKTLITATISFTAVSAGRTFTIQAKLEGSQVGTDVTCAAPSGLKTSCTISVLDTTSAANRTFTVTATQSGGTTNTVDTCNVTRISVLG